MRLLGGAGDDPDARGGRHVQPAAACRQRADGRIPQRPGGPERLGHQAHDLVVVHRAGGRDDHRVRLVALAVERVDRVPGDAGDRVVGAQDRAAEVGLAVHAEHELVVDEVRGIVVAHGDLLEDHPALGVDVLGADQRGGDDVADHVDGQRQVAVEHPGVEAGVLLGGERVHLPADRVEQRGDLHGLAPAGALEQQVLEVVRRAHLGVRLVARADPDPDAERGRADARHVLGDDPQAPGQDGPADQSPLVGGQQGDGGARLLVRIDRPGAGQHCRHAAQASPSPAACSSEEPSEAASADPRPGRPR